MNNPLQEHKDEDADVFDSTDDEAEEASVSDSGYTTDEEIEGYSDVHPDDNHIHMLTKEGYEGVI